MVKTQILQALLEAMPEAMIVVDTSGAIILANTQMERLFGYGNGELLGKRRQL